MSHSSPLWLDPLFTLLHCKLSQLRDCICTEIKPLPYCVVIVSRGCLGDVILADNALHRQLMHDVHCHCYTQGDINTQNNERLWIGICFMCSCCAEIHFPLPKSTKPSCARLSLNMANGAMDFYVFVLVQCFWHYMLGVSAHFFHILQAGKRGYRARARASYYCTHTFLFKPCDLGWPLLVDTCPSAHVPASVSFRYTVSVTSHSKINTKSSEQPGCWHLCVD